MVGVIVDGSGIAVVVGAGFFVVSLYSGSVALFRLVPGVVVLLIGVVLVVPAVLSLPARLYSLL